MKPGKTTKNTDTITRVNVYQVILADPPWPYETWSDKGKGRSADRHYSTMTLDDICALPVGDFAAKDCALFLWAIWPRIFDAERVIKAWGFRYATLAWEWAKLNPSGVGFFMGMGKYTRANCEPCLLAVRGDMPVATRSERGLLITPVQEHSRKPDEQYAKIERLYPAAKYPARLELFARRPWPGWARWGNEVESTVELAA